MLLPETVGTPDRCGDGEGIVKGDPPCAASMTTQLRPLISEPAPAALLIEKARTPSLGVRKRVASSWEIGPRSWPEERKSSDQERGE
jgi:hypothetical protein